MNTGDAVEVPGAGRGGQQAVRPAVGQPRHAHRSTVGASTVPEPSVRSWETAYRQYGQVSEMVARSSNDDPAAAWQMATASWAVAAAWREIATVARLPWWLLAAVESAAEAFEAQARDWEARESSSDASEGGLS